MLVMSVSSSRKKVGALQPDRGSLISGPRSTAGCQAKSSSVSSRWEIQIAPGEGLPPNSGPPAKNSQFPSGEKFGANPPGVLMFGPKLRGGPQGSWRLARCETQMFQVPSGPKPPGRLDVM